MSLHLKIYGCQFLAKVYLNVKLIFVLTPPSGNTR